MKLQRRIFSLILAVAVTLQGPALYAQDSAIAPEAQISVGTGDSSVATPAEDAEALAAAEADARAMENFNANRDAINRAFLLDLRDRVRIFMDMNYVYLKDLERCFSGQGHTIGEAAAALGLSTGAEILDYDKIDPRDVKTYADEYDHVGQNLSTALFNTCETEMNKIKNDIKETYPLFRRYLLLYNLLHPEMQKMLAYGVKHYIHTSFLYSNGTIDKMTPIPFTALDSRPFKHPLIVDAFSFLTPLWENDDEVIPFPKFSFKEYQSVLEGGDPLLNKAGEEIGLRENLSGFLQHFCETALRGDRLKSKLKNHSINFDDFAKGCRNFMFKEYVRDQKYWSGPLEGTKVGNFISKFSYTNDFLVRMDISEYPSQWAPWMVRRDNPKTFMERSTGTKPIKEVIGEVDQALTGGELNYAEAMMQRKNMERKIYALVQSSPYLALVSSSEPSNEELLGTVRVMMKAAEETREEFAEDYERLSQSKITDKDLRDLMKYGPVAASVLVLPGRNLTALNTEYSLTPKEFEHGYKALHKAHSRDELIRTLGEVGIVIGVIAGCMYGGKLLKIPKHALRVGKYLARFQWTRAFSANNIGRFFSPACIGVTAFPINGWFIYQSIANYHRVFREIFSSANGATFIHEVEALPAAKLEVLISVLTAPFDAPQALLVLRKAGIPFSKSAWGQLKKSLEESRKEFHRLKNVTRPHSEPVI